MSFVKLPSWLVTLQYMNIYRFQVAFEHRLEQPAADPRSLKFREDKKLIQKIFACDSKSDGKSFVAMTHKQRNLPPVPGVRLLSIPIDNVLYAITPFSIGIGPLRRLPMNIGNNL